MKDTGDRVWGRGGGVRDTGGGKADLPDDFSANGDTSEEGDPRTKSVTLLEHLVEEDHDDCGAKELDHDEDRVQEANGGRGAIDASSHKEN
jgi:hypothetical protein